jgi:ribose transport system substrate-binding protein
MKRFSLIVTAIVLLSVSGINGAFAEGKADAPKQGQKVRVAMVLKTLSSQYWKIVASGAQDAAAKNNVELILLGPPTEDAIEQQINMVQDALTRAPAVLCFSPSQPPTAVNVLNKAKEKGIPVILVDTTMPESYTDYKSFIGTTNYNAGKQAGEALVAKLAKGDKVVLIDGAPGNPSCNDRISGAEEVLKAAGMVIAAKQPANSDREKGYTVMQNILQGEPNVKAVFAANDEMALGALRALQQSGKNVPVIGVDGNTDALKSILAGDMYATIAQKPYDMGRLSVEKALELVAGKTIEKRIDSGTDVITKANAQKLLDFLSSIK